MSMQTNAVNRTLADVIGSVRNADGQVVVLIGAGCSKSAGIPLASGLIQEIKEKHPEAYIRAQQLPHSNVSYNAAMGELSPVERRKLLGGYIEKARINWAHLALAQLLKHQKIERVLSVNFDNLLIQACGVVGMYPPVYDLAATDCYSETWVAKHSLLYLNGQHTGFATVNSSAEFDEHKTKLKAVVQGTGTQVVWLVIGYSGEADPLLEVLAQQKRFNGDLYWLGHSDNPSEGLLKSGLFAEGKSTFYVGNQDADQALTHLAQTLGCFPPEILDQTFAHIAQLVGRIDFDTGGDAGKARQVILHKQLEQAKEAESLSETGLAEKWMLAGQFSQVQAWYADLTAPSVEQRDLGAWAYVMHGSALHDKAQQALKDQDLAAARALWKAAGEKYAQALSIKPEMHEAAINWGAALAEEAQALKDQDLPAARALWKAAVEKYAQALLVLEDDEAAYNWGNALLDEAKALKDQDLPTARVLLQEAGRKYAQALEIKKDFHEAAYNWGSALDEEAKAVKDQDLPAARALWQEAGRKYAQVLEINNDIYEAANNWSIVLLHEYQALRKTGNTEDAHAAVQCLAQAHALLEKHAAVSEAGKAYVAYNLACIYSLQGHFNDALAQLEISRQAAKNFPDSDHLSDDDDLALLRATPEYKSWFDQHFPNNPPH